MPDIIIGNGEPSCSATLVFELGSCDKHSVSENRTCYWATIQEGPLKGLDMHIYKHTDAGQRLTGFIAKKDLSSAKRLLVSLAFKHGKPNQLLARIQNNIEDAYRKGRRDKAEEIRNALQSN